MGKKAFIFILTAYNKARKKAMERRFYTIFSVFLATVLCLACFSFPQAWSAQPQPAPNDIRPSILAGTWYPANPDRLQKMILGFLTNTSVPRINGRLRAIIVPHAGYKYSGQVAAYAYRLLYTHRFKRIIMVGPSHRIPFPGVSVNLQKGYETPLGIVRVDVKVAREILNSDPNIHFYRDVHAVEHSLEIQLPFLQTVIKDFSIVPILMGSQDINTCRMLSSTLARVLPSLNSTLLLASSDLSHYHPYMDAKKLDACFIKLVSEMNPQALYDALRAGKCEACGGGPVISVMLTSLALGQCRALVLKAANSGDITGEKDRVVGYMAAALVTSSDKGPHPR